MLLHRDHVTGALAERVLSAAFRTGYWPPDSGMFDDFLAAAADIVSRWGYERWKVLSDRGDWFIQGRGWLIVREVIAA